MKIALSILCPLSIAALLVTGCGKSTETPAPPPDSGAAPAKTEGVIKDTANAVVAEGQKAVETVKTEAQTVVSNVTQAAKVQVDAATTQFNNLIAQTKTYITDKKYQDALTSLQQLSSLKLTPEQQKTVDDLKAQLQKLMASQTVTNILGGFRK